MMTVPVQIDQPSTSKDNKLPDNVKVEPKPSVHTSGFKRSSHYTGKRKYENVDKSKTKTNEVPMDVSPGHSRGDTHGDPKPSSSGMDASKKYKCYQCNFQTTTKGYLSRHMNTRHPKSHQQSAPRYDPKYEAKRPSVNDDRGLARKVSNPSGTEFDFMPKPMRECKTCPSNMAGNMSGERGEEPVTKRQYVEPYIPKRVYHTQRLNAPRLIPLESNNCPESTRDPRALKSDDIIPDSFKSYVTAVIDTKLAHALKGPEDRFNHSSSTSTSECQTIPVLMNTVCVQTDILMSMIFDDPHTTSDAQPCPTESMEVVDITKVTTDRCQTDQPTATSDHTYLSMPVF